MTDPTEALAERLFRDAAGALKLTPSIWANGSASTGRCTGGPATSGELAERTGTAERYVREWLEHHAASGLLEVDRPSSRTPRQRRFRLPAGHVPVLADGDDVRFGTVHGRSTSPGRPVSCRIWSTRSARVALPRRCRGNRRAGPPTTGGVSGLPGNGGCRDPRHRPAAAGRPAGAGGGLRLWSGLVQHRDREGLPTGHSGEASTSTRRRSVRRDPPRRRGWPAGCRSPSPTPRIRRCPAGSTW